MTEHRGQSEAVNGQRNPGAGVVIPQSAIIRQDFGETSASSVEAPSRVALEERSRAMRILRSSRGFTFIELMIVLAIMGVLITIAQPNLKQAIVRAREAVLRENLFQMREAIDQYYADNDKYPAELADLINQTDKSRSYLRDIPKDPFTDAPDWIIVGLEGEEGGVFDVHSASPLVAVDGTPYNTW